VGDERGALVGLVVIAEDDSKDTAVSSSKLRNKSIIKDVHYSLLICTTVYKPVRNPRLMDPGKDKF
jgi:hypothetical protein